MSSLYLDIVSTKEEIYSGEVNSVFAPSTSGEIGIFPGHMALIATLKPGEIRIKVKNHEESIFIAGGIIEVQPKIVTIFSDTVVRANDLDEAKILEAKQKAQKIIKNADKNQDLTATKNVLAEAMAQLQMINKLRKK